MDYDDDEFPGSEAHGATIKITQAAWEFLAPFVGPEFSTAELRKAMGIAVDIWNACVLDSQEESDQHVVQVRQQCIAKQRAPRDIVEAMIRRKRRYFRSDLRLVDHFQVCEEHGETAFHVAAKGEGPPWRC